MATRKNRSKPLPKWGGEKEQKVPQLEDTLTKIARSILVGKVVRLEGAEGKLPCEQKNSWEVIAKLCKAIALTFEQLLDHTLNQYCHTM